MASPDQQIQLHYISSWDDLKLIILVTWKSARPSYISKYLQGYQALYPTFSILLIRSTPADLLYRRTRTQRYRVALAVSIIVAACKSTDDEKAILLHAFSNGGSHQTLDLPRAYSETTSSPFPPHVTILDSCPDHGTVQGSVRALSTALPKTQPLRLLLLLLICLVVGFHWLTSVFGTPDPIQCIRQALNDKNLATSELSRCYIYSETVTARQIR